MFLKYYKPTTPSKRGRRIIKKNFYVLKPKTLNTVLRRPNGKVYNGHQTLRSKGGANFNHYRIVDYIRTKLIEDSKLTAMDFDNFRTGHLGLVHFKNGAYSYILVSEGTRINSTIKTSSCCADVKTNLSWRVPLYSVPTKTIINSIETRPTQGGKLVRAAGTGAKVLKKLSNSLVLVLMPSKKVLKVNANVMVTIGKVSNHWHKFEIYSKAGYSYILNRKPIVRGESMNPVDHPHGGRTRGGIPRKNPWGKIIK